MTPLDWLFQLTRVSEKNNAFSGLRNGETIRQRHLRRFIDKQDIDPSPGVGSSPKPGRSTPT
jgi:hypothetical protein